MLISIKVFSQDTTQRPSIVPTSISFFRSGGETIYFNYPQFEELLSMTSLTIFPSSRDSFSKYNSAGSPFRFRQFNGFIGFQTRRGRVTNSKNEWQVGISYASGKLYPFSFTRNNVIPGDTLGSGNLTVFSDTSMSYFYQYRITMNELALDAGRILNVDLSHRLRLSFGIVIQAGFTINSIVRALHDTSTIVNYYINGELSSWYSYISSPADLETKNLKSSIFIRSYLPVGVSFRLAKEQWWLHSFSVAVKSTFGVEYLHINQTGYFNPYWTAGVGIIYSF